MEEHPRRGCGVSLLLIIGAILLCSVGSTLVVDNLCYTNVTPRLPMYPGAQVTSENHNFLRSFGMGMTEIYLYTQDDADKVRSWYGRAIGENMKEFARSSTGYMGDSQWDVQPTPDGKGTRIYLYSRCAS